MEDNELLIEDLDLEPKSWWCRFVSWLKREPIYLVPVEDDEPNATSYKKEVASIIEAAISSCIWANRFIEENISNVECFKVLSVSIKEVDDEIGEYQLYVWLNHEYSDDAPICIPLHEFLEQYYPTRDLSFTDYNA